MDDLSPQAIKACQESRARQAGRALWIETGPRLHEGTLYVPSPCYIEELADFWRTQGFTFRRAEYSGQHEWVRDTRRPLRGKRYTPQAWLAAARRKYQEFYGGDQ